MPEKDNDLFEVKILAIGKHGCGHHTGDGEKIRRCGLQKCPDCMTNEFIQVLQMKGYKVMVGEFTHFKGAVSREEVIDDLVTNVRHGQL